MLKWPWGHIDWLSMLALIPPVVIVKFLYWYWLSPTFISRYCVVAGQTIDTLKTTGTRDVNTFIGIFLREDILLPDMLNSWWCDYLMNSWWQIWHSLRLVCKFNGTFCISNTFSILAILIIDHVLNSFNNGKEIRLGCFEVVL
jgi:hypothetical protein